LNTAPTETEYRFPGSVEEAIELKEQFGERARFIAGGTDLLLLMEQQRCHPELLIDLTKIRSLQGFSVGGGHVRIGSAITYSQLLASPAFTQAVPFLADAIRTIGGVQVRNVATLVGNITNASPAGDTLAPLYVLNTTIHVSGPRGSRLVPIEDFILDVRRIDLKDGELVTHVCIDIPDQEERGAFEKLGRRRAMAIAVVSVCAVLRIDHGRVEGARIALGAVAPTIMRVRDVEAFLVGRALDTNTIGKAGSLASELAKPIDDIRASAGYRRLAVRGLVRRALENIRARIE
jgi:carbon-monoxide dehydrogenase medium subunit